MANSVYPDQTAPLVAVWSGSTLFVQILLTMTEISLYQKEQFHTASKCGTCYLRGYFIRSLKCVLSCEQLLAKGTFFENLNLSFHRLANLWNDRLSVLSQILVMSFCKFLGANHFYCFNIQMCSSKHCHICQTTDYLSMSKRLFEPRHEKTCLWCVWPGKTNRPAQLRKLARVLKFWIW